MYQELLAYSHSEPVIQLVETKEKFKTQKMVYNGIYYGFINTIKIINKSPLRSPAQVEGTQGFLPQPGKALERPP